MPPIVKTAGAAARPATEENRIAAKQKPTILDEKRDFWIIVRLI
jgi:hypothetical protein